MEHDDDPEKRIAELGRMQGSVSGGRWDEQPGPYPPPPPHPGWPQAPNTYPAQPQPGWQQASGWPQQPPHPWQPPSGQAGYESPPAHSANWPVTSPLHQSRRSSSKVVFVCAAVFLAVAILGVVGMKGYAVYGYAVGTPATAQVDSCSKNGRADTTCRGSWTVNGVQQYGSITGAEYEARGSTVNVRVHDGTAYTSGVAGQLLAPLLGLLAWTVGLGVYWYFRRRRRFRQSRDVHRG